eukprot:3336938-Ditylum_brightwellii.AAC.1
MAALRNLSHAPDVSAGLGTDTGTKTFYCWTHGETRGSWHTSKNCRKQKEGHETEAAKPLPRNK